MSLFNFQRTIRDFRFEPEVPISAKRRNFNPQNEAGIRCLTETPTAALKSSSFELTPNGKTTVANQLVEVRGFEPLTPALQTRCSAN